MHYELIGDRSRIIFITKSAGPSAGSLSLLKLSSLFVDTYAIKRPLKEKFWEKLDIVSELGLFFSAADRDGVQLIID